MEMTEYNNENRGVLFENDRRNGNSKAPYWKGQCTIKTPDGELVELWISGWEQNSRSGDPFISLSFEIKEERRGRDRDDDRRPARGRDDDRGRGRDRDDDRGRSRDRDDDRRPARASRDRDDDRRPARSSRDEDNDRRRRDDDRAKDVDKGLDDQIPF
jgi:hypothetical protein